MSGYGVFSTSGAAPRLGWRDGDEVIDLSGLGDVYTERSLNALMALGPDAWAESLAQVRAHDGPRVPLGEATMHLPFEVADYVDFYSSLEHATNLGRLFRPDAEPLLPNWRWLPVGYHGRAGTVVVSGTEVRRPSGQLKLPDAAAPVYGPSRRLDIELELGFVVGVPSRLGDPVEADRFKEHVFGVVLVTFQYLLGQLLLSQQRAEELELRSKQLASFQVGMLSAMLRTLDLRDQMTARHSAAVARYSRAIAQRAGYSRREEELVHIAALLHDIGKFILPDRILKANVPLTDEDWMLIKRHPQQGARVVSSLDGYGPVAEIILAHHERIDGKGYPRGLEGDAIPELSRIISVADTYDVMTARDSYRTPMSSYDAIVELRRVAGKQLDSRFVEVFIELLDGKDVSFQHGEAADFEKELALESRIAETASPDGEANRFQVAGVSV